ncbi:hypothetical protein [Arthrobacter sp. UYEF20]|uniref:hypothetical protein n=1 Tax=Arthrobacter sp. UYEF20 TaxID=1756363 RepID=UPI00339129C6
MLEILDAAEAEVSARRADTVLVAAGINDLLHADGRGGARVGQDVIARLESFCDAMELQGRRVVVMSPNWRAPWSRLPTGRDPGPAGEHAVLVPADLPGLPRPPGRPGRPPGLFSDGLRPTTEGHRLVAESVGSV